MDYKLFIIIIFSPILIFIVITICLFLYDDYTIKNSETDVNSNSETDVNSETIYTIDN